MDCIRVDKIDLCDCLGDTDASPTADYNMLATCEAAETLKVNCQTLKP